MKSPGAKLCSGTTFHVQHSIATARRAARASRTIHPAAGGDAADHEAEDILREALEDNGTSESRAVADLVEAVSSSSTHDLRISAAAALGMHGTRKGLEALIELATDDGQSPVVRATAMQAARIVLGQQPSMTVPDLLKQANFSTFPATLIRLLQVPL